jgi:hypothetical protein
MGQVELTKRESCFSVCLHITKKVILVVMGLAQLGWFIWKEVAVVSPYSEVSQVLVIGIALWGIG